MGKIWEPAPAAGKGGGKPLPEAGFVCSLATMIGRGLRIALTVAAPLVTAGCGGRTNLPPAQSETGQPANFQLVTDIPIPPGATMDNERSLILSDHDHWEGRVVMRFWQAPPELTVFYQNQMPGFGWEPVMSVTSDSSVLSYVHGDRAATIQIEKSLLGMTSVVSVTVAPRQTGGAASASSYGGSSGYQTGATSRPVRAESLPPPGRP